MLQANVSQAAAGVVVTTSGSDVSFKELFILGLFFALFFYSIFSFMKIWNTTYREIGAFYHYVEDPTPSPSPSPSRKSSIRRGFKDFNEKFT